MKLAEIVFSPTGGTQRVLNALAVGFAPEAVRTIDLADPAFAGGAVQPDEVALIAIPSYAGRVPALAAARLARVAGSGAACVLVCVYGNRAFEDTLAEMEDLAVGCGFRVLAGVAAIAEHSVVRQFAAGRPDADDKAALAGFAAAIAQKAAAGWAPAAMPGSRPYKKAGGGMVPQAGEGCTGCGLCAAKCPAAAIDPADPRRTDGAKCIGCMRCIAVCPRAARALPPEKLAAITHMLRPVCTDRRANELFL